MICKICKSHSEFLFTKQVLKKYAVGYHRCTKCGFVQTDEPYWLDEAYDQAINLSDTGYIARNLFFRNKLKYFFKIKYSPDDVFLDFGAVYGVFTRMMRDLNFDFRWSDEYTQNIFTRGFEASPELERYAAIREMAGYFGMHAFSSGSLYFLTRKRLRGLEKMVIKLSALPHRVETKLFGTRIWVDQMKFR